MEKKLLKTWQKSENPNFWKLEKKFKKTSKNFFWNSKKFLEQWSSSTSAYTQSQDCCLYGQYNWKDDVKKMMLKVQVSGLCENCGNFIESYFFGRSFGKVLYTRRPYSTYTNRLPPPLLLLLWGWVSKVTYWLKKMLRKKFSTCKGLKNLLKIFINYTHSFL